MRKLYTILIVAVVLVAVAYGAASRNAVIAISSDWDAAALAMGTTPEQQIAQFQKNTIDKYIRTKLETALSKAQILDDATRSTLVDGFKADVDTEVAKKP